MNRVYYAFRSPYSRLGLHVVKRAGLAVELIPFTGPPDGIPFSDPVSNPAKFAYYVQDVPRMTMRMDLPLALPQPFDVDYTHANKAAVGAERAGCGLAFAIAVSDARWGRGEDISDLAVLDACAEACGWSSQAARACLSDADVSDALQQQRQLIEEDGVFGVPFAVIVRPDANERFWGHDRFDLFIQSAQAG